MSMEAAEAVLVVTAGKPMFSFTATGSEVWPRWDRYIAVGGEPVFHLGNVCNTCDFVFARVSSATQSFAPGDVAARLNRGMTSLDDEPLDRIAEILPAGRYQPLLSSDVPRLVRPGDPADYFTREQVALWAVEPSIARNGVWDPRTDYYRLGSHDLGEGRALFEFLVPTFPAALLRPDVVDAYRASPVRGTALAVSVLDVKRPAIFDDSPVLAVTEHWCLTH
jgi:hypothetical protein